MSSTKRPLEDPSSPSAPTDLPEAKRPALDKIAKDDATAEGSEAPVAATGSATKTKEELELPALVTNGATEAHAEAASAAGTNGGPTLPGPDGQAVLSTASQTERASSQPPSTAPQDETNWIHIRAVISSAEAATCIGKGGENVTQIRKLSGAKCTVSDYSRGAVERILTVSGAQDAVAKVYCKPPLYDWKADLSRRSASSSVPSIMSLLRLLPRPSPRHILYDY